MGVQDQGLHLHLTLLLTSLVVNQAFCFLTDNRTRNELCAHEEE